MYSVIMSAAIKQIVTVRSGGVVELRSPDLHEGDQAEVTVVVMKSAGAEPRAVAPGGWRKCAGAVNSGDAKAGNNSCIDAALAAEYGSDLKPGS